MVLVDTLIWIDYFHGEDTGAILDDLIDNQLVCINDLILAELLPSINRRKEWELKNALLAVPRLALTIHWDEIIAMQTRNLQNGINRVGIPALLIVQNSLQNNILLLTHDKHFRLMKDLFHLDLYSK